MLGSFYTALASRILYYFYGPGRKQPGRWKSILASPSFCMHCKTPLRPWQLVPVLSFALQKGRCSRCETPIGWYTLAGELLPALLLPFLIFSGTSPWQALLLVLIVGHLYISIATDTKLFLLDHENALFLSLFVLTSLVLRYIGGEGVAMYLITGGITSSLFLLFRILAGGDRFGTGDLILISVLSFMTPGIWSAIWIQVASILALVQSLLQKKSRKDPIPFGVHLSLGFILVQFIRGFSVLWTGYRWTGF